MIKSAILVVLTLGCASCSSGGSSGGSSGLNASECQSLIRKGWELNSVSFDVPDSKLVFDRSVQSCVDGRMYSRKDYDCMMRANSTESYTQCGGS